METVSVDYLQCFDEFLETTPDLYLFLDANLNILGASKAYLKATMKKSEEIIGKNVFVAFPDNSKDGESGRRAKESFERVLKTKTPDTMGVLKYDLLKPNTKNKEFEERYWTVINLPVLDTKKNLQYILHRAEDVTSFIKLQNTQKEQMEAIKNLRTMAGKSEQQIYLRSQELQDTNNRLHKALQEIESHQYSVSKLAAIVQATDDAVIAIDISGRIESFNHGAEKLYGYEASEVIGKSFDILYPPEKMHEVEELLNHIKTNDNPLHIETDRKHKDGHLIPVSLSISPIKNRAGEIIGACSLARDISEFKRITQLKNEFVSIVSHELRTPLTSIQGSLSLLASGSMGQLPENVLKLINIGKQNSERLIRLINDILDVEKIESGKIELKLEPVNADLIARQAIISNESFAEKFQIKLKLIQITTAKINVDHDRFLQVLTNLISNAIKFSFPDTEVTITVQKINDWVKISVTNTGPGISPDFKSQIFQKFSQAEATKSKSHVGTGLGLNISKQIVELLGGKISFTSEINKETTFWVELPVYKKEEERKHVFEKYPVVLLCEHVADATNNLQHSLEDSGFKVIVAPTLKEAKTLLENKKIDLLLLDLSTAKDYAIVFVKDIRKTFNPAELPIVVFSLITGVGNQKLNGNAITLVDWIEKPADVRSLIDTIKSIREQLKIKIPNILHVEDDSDLVQVSANLLQDEANVTSATSIAEAKTELNNSHFDLVILDLMLPDGSGLDLLPLLSEKHIPVIVFSAYDIPKDYGSYVISALLKSKVSLNDLLQTVHSALNYHPLPPKEM